MKIIDPAHLTLKVADFDVFLSLSNHELTSKLV